ncbi:MAG: hypothetical protein H0V18_16455 [Pyrinomonadaceae bacterium]|jgi:hypothetical protein|nr:hypothetical protein [Pyrinomonadaceae bacterium]
MTEEQQLEETVEHDFNKLAYRLGSDVLRGLATNYPQRFAQWVADLKFGPTPRYALNFQAWLQLVDEAKTDMLLAADTVSDEGVH